MEIIFKKKSIITIVLLVLFFFSNFIQTATADYWLSSYMILLPPYVKVASGYIRWLIFGLLIVFFFGIIKKKYELVNAPIKLISFFYFIQLIYALGSQTDITRYLSLTVMSFIIPYSISYSLTKDKDDLLKYVKYIIYFIFLLSVLLNFKVLFLGLRFQGIFDNPNLYGITGVFWLSILLIESDKKKLAFKHLIFIALVFVSILLSGSRTSFVASIVVIFFAYYRYAGKLIVFSALLFFALYILSFYIDIDFIFNRFENIETSAIDSGRSEVWKKAFVYINQEPLWGHGMNSPEELVETGNMHNCYIRYLLNMGIVFTTLAFIPYIIMLIKILLNLKIIPPSLVGFIFAFTIGNFGEDFFVGLGSVVYIYLTFAVGLISYFLYEKDQ